MLLILRLPLTFSTSKELTLIDFKSTFPFTDLTKTWLPEILLIFIFPLTESALNSFVYISPVEIKLPLINVASISTIVDAGKSIYNSLFSVLKTKLFC